MKTFYLEFKISFVTERCRTCGRWWAREDSRQGTCPYCQSVYYSDLELRNDRLQNQVTSLKGQITKLKKRLKG